MRVCQFDFARRGSSASRQRISRAGGVWRRRCGNTRCRRRRIIKAEGIFHKVPRLPPPHPSIYSKTGSANDGTIGERVPWRFGRQVDFPVQKKNSATNGYPYAKQDGWHPKTLTLTHLAGRFFPAYLPTSEIPHKCVATSLSILY